MNVFQIFRVFRGLAPRGGGILGDKEREFGINGYSEAVVVNQVGYPILNGILYPGLQVLCQYMSWSELYDG